MTSPAATYAEAELKRLFRDTRRGAGIRQRLVSSRVFQPCEMDRIIRAAFAAGEASEFHRRHPV